MFGEWAKKIRFSAYFLLSGGLAGRNACQPLLYDWATRVELRYYYYFLIMR